MWGRWFIFLVVVFEFVYRPGFWYYEGHFEYTLLLAPLVVFNGLTQYRLLRNGWVTWRWLLLLSAMDIALATVGVIIQGGFGKGFIFVAYYPALALFVVVFTSLWLGLAWTTMTAGIYTLVCLKVGPGLDFVAGHEKELLVRVAGMYALALYVVLVARFERTRRQAAVEGERRLQQERIELSQSIHDTTAQSAYLIGLGIDAARKLAGNSNRELAARLEATSPAVQDRHLAAETPDRHGEHIRRQRAGQDPGLARCDVHLRHVGGGGADAERDGAASFSGGQEPAVHHRP